MKKANKFLQELYYYVNETDGAPANAVAGGGVAGIRPGEDPPMSVAAQKRWRDTTGETFAGSRVFEVDMDTLINAKNGKEPPHRYDRYFSDRVKQSGHGEAIREYGRKNPGKNIVLKDSATGAMVFLRRPKVRVSECLLTEAATSDDVEKLITQAAALDAIMTVFNEHYSGRHFPNLGEISKMTHKAVLKRLSNTLREFVKTYNEATK